MRKQLGTHSYFNIRGTELQMKKFHNGFVEMVSEFL